MKGALIIDCCQFTETVLQVYRGGCEGETCRLQGLPVEDEHPDGDGELHGPKPPFGTAFSRSKWTRGTRNEDDPMKATQWTSLRDREERRDSSPSGGLGWRSAAPPTFADLSQVSLSC